MTRAWRRRCRDRIKYGEGRSTRVTRTKRSDETFRHKQAGARMVREAITTLASVTYSPALTERGNFAPSKLPTGRRDRLFRSGLHRREHEREVLDVTD
jgi:hypothetical protein